MVVLGPGSESECAERTLRRLGEVMRDNDQGGGGEREGDGGGCGAGECLCDAGPG